MRIYLSLIIVNRIVDSTTNRMLQITKKFRFEMAHAIYGYSGKCRNVHGHSYLLEVTIGPANNETGYLPAPGFVIDFKDLKKIVKDKVVDLLDHTIVLSTDYLKANPAFTGAENIIVWPYEPSAENILLFVRDSLLPVVPSHLLLKGLRLHETADSFAEWINPVTLQR